MSDVVVLIKADAAKLPALYGPAGSKVVWGLAIARNVSADPSVENCLGPKLRKRFTTNPAVEKYDFVIRFPTAGVVTGRAMAQALKSLSEPRGAALVAAYDFTVEARQMAATRSSDLVWMIEFGWTDAAYAARMLRD